MTSMRINRFIATSTGVSRRNADLVIEQNRVLINDKPAKFSDVVSLTDKVTLDRQRLTLSKDTLQTILFNKPAGYVVSRNGQGSKTIYDILPKELLNLKPIGRLDKDSSGLLLLTNNGELAQQLTHPSFQKIKVYEVELNTDLQPLHQQIISDIGITLDDGLSKFGLEQLVENNHKIWRITMREGRNRQIRRTFAALNYKVLKLHRTIFGEYILPRNLSPGKYQTI
jgi:23S rRNA pseudouridine2605 synthase